MVSIAAFQAVDPGSIPGHRIFLLNICTVMILVYLRYTQLVLLVMVYCYTYDLN
jgi:hypothetical protein